MGNLETLTYPDGRQVHYEYNQANLLKTVTDWNGRVTTYDYDKNGRVIKTTRPNGTILTCSYDDAGQLLQMKDVDGQGNIISQYDFTYNSVGNVETEIPVAEEPLTMGDAAMTYATDNRIATYDGQSVSYDADGNMTQGPLNEQMIGAGGTMYQYDAENNRISVTDSVYNGQTDYVINPNASLSQVLIKTDNQGNQTYYVYGLGLIGQEENGVYRSYHFDLRGSTVAVTEDNGSVTDRFQYGPYGELVNHTGDTSTQFLYNGRDGVMTDTNGLYYMRARYYCTESKRFINKDIILGSIETVQSLNRYAYVVNNPVNYIDPTGMDSVRELSGYKELNQPTLTRFANWGQKTISNPLTDYVMEGYPGKDSSMFDQFLWGAKTTLDVGSTCNIVGGLEVKGVVQGGIKGIKLISLINKDKRLIRAAEEMRRDPVVQKEADNLVEKLMKGNVNPGKGNEYIGFGGIFELRGANGARVYFRNVKDGFEILAKSNKDNQQKVINILSDLYK